MTTLRIAGGQVLRPDMTVEETDVLVDQDEGEILAVGPADDLPEADETLDADDGLVIPGLVNAHCHAAMTLLRGYADDKPLESWLREDIWPVEAELTPEDVRAGTELGLLEMIQSGTTGFADMYFHVEKVVEAVEDAGLRARLGHGIVTIGRDEAAAREDFETSLEIAAEFDGAADGRISTAVMPHSLTTVGEEYLEEYIPQTRELGVPLHYHANETEDEVSPIVDERKERPLSYARDMDMTDVSDFVAHGVHVNETEIELLAETGTGVIHCPASNMKLASGMAPIQAMLDAGVTVGLGTDGTASNNDLDMFGEMRDAAMLGKLASNDASAVDAESVVRMATEGSATALGFNSGRIEEGANADLAVLDLSASHLTPRHDLVSHLAYAARGSDVIHTICDGNVLMADKEVLIMDERSVRKKAEKRAKDAIERASN
ncbi:5-methylthioadenosine/S-adenosylhomocysteine deaminase [Haladaptatus litoreus]|uniref:5-methylthioadenosine/S-adenosylhomocysteine deaminase n=1 Tax=Haladaptatus litoreus TaxID=553468 RepID=A0A1N7BF27_9EURY|nr:amidohydrolase [Haladaptatus litoreus]SIR49940.1 5-methylthioadenosine/S-adenosylhomocysteine deaminase [Haladaptatus litoreus]